MPTFGTYTDTRDGHAYRCVLMPDGNWWFAEDVVYASSEFPGYYGWAEAVEAANMPGCRIPRRDYTTGNDEWANLFAACGGFGEFGGAGYNLKTATGWTLGGIDLYGFAVSNRGYYSRNYNQPGPWYYTAGTAGNTGTVFIYDYSQWSVGNALFQNTLNATSVGGTFDKYWDQYGSGRMHPLRLIVDPVYVVLEGPKLYGATFDGFERSATTVRIERNIRWVPSIGGGVQGIPTLGPDGDTWQISTAWRVNAEQALEIEASVGPYIGTPGAVLALPPRFGETSFPGLGPALAGTTQDTYVSPCVLNGGLRGGHRVALVTDLFEYTLDFDLTASAGDNPHNVPTTPRTNQPSWLAGKFAAARIEDASNERRGIGANGHYNPLLYSAKHGRTMAYSIEMDWLTQTQADEIVAYFRGVRHSPEMIQIDAGCHGLESFWAHLTELSFTRSGLHWSGTLEVVRVAGL